MCLSFRLLLLLLFGPVSALASANDPYAQARAQLAEELSAQTGLAAARIHKALAQARFVPEVIARITRPYEALPYRDYRPLFVNASLIRQGRAYLRAHKDAFARAWHRWHVEPALIAAILGVETHYGTEAGRFRVLDALFTLSVGYPRRAAFFRRELGALLVLADKEGLDPAVLRGSYAGAFGITQFIPSSYLAYAADGDGDGKRDVWHSHADAIASVARYFHAHGWRAHRPVAEWLPRDTNPSLAGDLRDFQPLRALRHKLPRLHLPWLGGDRVAVLRFETDTGARLALVHQNFYVITRWNRSSNYAMAVAELAAALGCKRCVWPRP